MDEGADHVAYNTEYRKNRDLIYSELAEKLKSVNFEAMKERFSPDDNFFLARQQKKDIDASDEYFDAEGGMAARLLGSNAVDEIEKVTPHIKNLGPPRKVLLSSCVNASKMFDNDQGHEQHTEINDANGFGNEKKQLKSEEQIQVDFQHQAESMLQNTQQEKTTHREKQATNNNQEPQETNLKQLENGNKQTEQQQTITRQHYLQQQRSRIGSHAERSSSKRQSSWAATVQQLKQNSSAMAAEYFQHNNIFLHNQLESYEQRFNNGDGTSIPAKQQETPLMQQLQELADRNSMESTKKNNVYKLAMTSSVMEEATQVVEGVESGRGLSGMWKEAMCGNEKLELKSVGVSCGGNTAPPNAEEVPVTVGEEASAKISRSGNFVNKSLLLMPQQASQDGHTHTFKVSHQWMRQSDKARNYAADEDDEDDDESGNDDDDDKSHSRLEWLKMREASKRNLNK